jgi:hypothetical protein
MPTRQTGMYRVHRERYPEVYDKQYIGEVCFLSDIRRTCHLIPDFGRETRYFSASSLPPLESYDHFYLNAYLDPHIFLLLH